jgi:NDP-sugar pyrophosphorylase family protein
MEAVILAGGKGSRLRPYTTTLPKPLMPVGEQPILQHLLRQLRRAGCDRVTMAVNHMADLIQAFFGNGEKFGLEIRYSVEDRALGTVGPLTLIPDLPEHFLVMNGDILTDLDFADLYRAHVDGAAALTISSCRRESRIDFGVMHIDADTNQVTDYLEKPVSYFNVSMGVYAFSRAVVADLPKGVPYGFDSLVLDMLRAERVVRTYPFSGYWLDIGRPDDYDRANEEIGTLKWLE